MLSLFQVLLKLLRVIIAVYKYRGYSLPQVEIIFSVFFLSKSFSFLLPALDLFIFSFKK